MAQPSATHRALADLQRAGYVRQLITQNVDRLHHAAWPGHPPRHVELHGSLSEVVCIGHGQGTHSDGPAWWEVNATTFGPIDRYSTQHIHDKGPGCGFVAPRDALQDHLAATNPDWAKWAQRLQDEPALSLRRNPDGDVHLEGVDYETFDYPPCPSCGGILKPDVVFFGENVRGSVRHEAEDAVHQCDALVAIGTTLATHSAYRLVKEVVEAGKPVVLLNRGPTRVDALVPTRIGLDCAEVIPAVANQLL